MEGEQNQLRVKREELFTLWLRSIENTPRSISMCSHNHCAFLPPEKHQTYEIDTSLRGPMDSSQQSLSGCAATEQ